MAMPMATSVAVRSAARGATRAGRTGVRLLGLGLAAALAATAPAAAEEAEKSVDEQILEILRDEGRIDEDRYQELLEQSREEEAARTAPAVSGAAPAHSGWDFGWKNGFYLNRADGDVKLKFGGRIQIDAAALGLSSNLDQLVGGEGTGVEFRRARVFFDGTFYGHGIFKAQYEFAGGDAQFKDVFVGLQKLPAVGRVRVGHMKEPFSIQQMTSAKYLTFLERGLSDVFAPARNTGIMVDRTFHDERVYLGVGAFRDADDFGDGFGNDSRYNLTARISGLPVWEEDGERLVHVGFAYSRQLRDEDMLRYRERPEAHLANRFVDTGAIGNVEGVDLFVGELASVCGPVHFLTEVAGAYVDRGAGVGNPWLWGGFAEIGWFLTGETRAYKPADAVFARTSPLRPFDPSKGQWGAFEVAARFSYLDLDDRDAGVRGGTLEDVTAGFNWYLFPNLRLMLNYVYAWRHGAGNANIGQARVSFDF